MHLQIEMTESTNIYKRKKKKKRETVAYVRHVTTKPVTQFYFKEDYWTFWGGDQLLTFQILIFKYLWYNLKYIYYFRGPQANTKLHRPWVQQLSLVGENVLKNLVGLLPPLCPSLFLLHPNESQVF